MMDDVFVYIVDLPDGVNEMVTPCLAGYTVYINDKLSPEGRHEAYRHALYHINNNDFEKEDVNQIELEAHAHTMGGHNGIF